MELEKLTVEAVLKEIGQPPPAQELALVPKDQQSLFCELRRNNNLLNWLIVHTVQLNNTVQSHDNQLSPMRQLGRMFVWLIGIMGGVAGIIEVIKLLNGQHK
jgi:hypothetical protein